MGLQKTIDHLVDFETVDDSALERRLDSQELDLEGMSYLQRWWLQRMAYSARPLQEKMTLFWHGILTSSFRKTGRGLRRWIRTSSSAAAAWAGTMCCSSRYRGTRP